MSNTTTAPKNIGLMFLKAFLATGGIEKVNRVLLRVLWDMEQEGKAKVFALSPYAIGSDQRYFPEEKLWGYKGNKVRFMVELLLMPPKVDVLLVSHINLGAAVWLLKWRRPKAKVILLAHGIEVWSPVNRFKRWFLHHADGILAVSRYTADKIQEVHGVPAEKIKVLPNCLDPYFEPPQDFEKPAYLLERYGLKPDQPILLTVSRLNSQEGYKGYDKVIQALPELIKSFPELRYILAGKYDEKEKQRLDSEIKALGVTEYVAFPGFVPDEELIDHYRLATLFVMPSKKEGFGLVFIEAMASGTMAIGGNQDGSVEALSNFGISVNPDDANMLISIIYGQLISAEFDKTNLSKKVSEQFSFYSYYNTLKAILRIT